MSGTPATLWWPGNQNLSVPMGPSDAQHEMERPGEGAMKPTVTDPSDRSRTSDHWRPSDAVSSPGTAPRIQFRNGLKSDSASAAGVVVCRRVRSLVWHLDGGTVPARDPPGRLIGTPAPPRGQRRLDDLLVCGAREHAVDVGDAAHALPSLLSPRRPRRSLMPRLM